MSKRYQNKERLGIHRIALIVVEEFRWIFREQPIVDVGIDALVEKSVKGEPSGKFLALQIKSGKGNVYKSKSKDEYIYYMSNIHYYYWINLDMPILLLCYIPAKKKVFWNEVKKANVTKTNKGWKISLPLRNEFNGKSYKTLDKIISTGKGKMLTLTDINQESIYNIEHIDLVNDSLITLTQITNTYTSRINHCTSMLEELIHEENSIIKNSKVEVQKYTLLTAFESLASRIYNEIHIFSKTYVKAILAIKSNYILLLLNNEKDLVENDLASVSSMVEKFTDAINGMEYMRKSIENLEGENFLSNNSCIEKANTAMEKVVLELTQAQNLGRKLVEDIQDEMIK